MNVFTAIGAGIVAFVVGLAIVGIIALILAFPVMWLWNFAMVAIGVKAISYWVSFCLILLTGILIKSSSVSSK